MDRNLVRDFFACGDNEFIEFAIMRARLNSREKWDKSHVDYVDRVAWVRQMLAM